MGWGRRKKRSSPALPNVHLTILQGHGSSRLSDSASFADLARLLDDNLWATAKHFDAPCDAEPLAPILHLRLTKFRAVTAPDYRCEDVVRIGGVQVEEGGCPIEPRRKSRTRHYAAHRGRFLHMIWGLLRRECGGLGSYDRQEPAQDEYPAGESAQRAAPTIHCVPFTIALLNTIALTYPLPYPFVKGPVQRQPWQRYAAPGVVGRTSQKLLYCCPQWDTRVCASGAREELSRLQ